MLPRPHPGVLFKTVSDGAVLLHVEEEIYFGLNDVGTRIWQLLPPACGDLNELCARLAELYADVPPEVLRADVVELLNELEANQLVVAYMSHRAPTDPTFVHLSRRLFSLPASEFGELLMAQVFLLGALWTVRQRPKGTLLRPVDEGPQAARS